MIPLQDRGSIRLADERLKAVALFVILAAWSARIGPDLLESFMPFPLIPWDIGNTGISLESDSRGRLTRLTPCS
jgi:hypothetical protein